MIEVVLKADLTDEGGFEKRTVFPCFVFFFVCLVWFVVSSFSRTYPETH